MLEALKKTCSEVNKILNPIVKNPALIKVSDLLNRGIPSKLDLVRLDMETDKRFTSLGSIFIQGVSLLNDLYLDENRKRYIENRFGVHLRNHFDQVVQGENRYELNSLSEKRDGLDLLEMGTYDILTKKIIDLYVNDLKITKRDADFQFTLSKLFHFQKRAEIPPRFLNITSDCKVKIKETLRNSGLMGSTL